MNRYARVVALLLFVFLIGACASGQAERAATTGADEHAGMSGMSGQMQGMEGSDKAAGMTGDEHGTATHGIPAEAAAVPNPVPVSDASVAAGRATYAQY